MRRNLAMAVSPVIVIGSIVGGVYLLGLLGEWLWLGLVHVTYSQTWYVAVFQIALVWLGRAFMGFVTPLCFLALLAGVVAGVAFVAKGIGAVADAISEKE